MFYNFFICYGKRMKKFFCFSLISSWFLLNLLENSNLAFVLYFHSYSESKYITNILCKKYSLFLKFFFEIWYMKDDRALCTFCCNIDEGESSDSRTGCALSGKDVTQYGDIWFLFRSLQLAHNCWVRACNFSSGVLRRQAVEVAVSRRHVTQLGAIRALKAWRVSSLKTLNCGSSIIDVDHWSRTNDCASREFLRSIKTDAIARSLNDSPASGLFTAFQTQRLQNQRQARALLSYTPRLNVELLFLLKLLIILQLSYILHTHNC